MSTIEEKQKKRGVSRAKITTFISLMVLVFFVYSLTREIVNRQQINQKIRNLEDEVKTLETKNYETANLLQGWQSDNQLEKEARLKLGLRKPGEQVVIINRDNAPTSSQKNITPTGGAKNINDKGSNPYLWWKYFFSS